MNEKRTSTENLHCALKHAYVLPISFLEIVQKAEYIYDITKDENVKQYINSLYKIKDEVEKIIQILEQIYYCNEKITFEDLTKIKKNIRVLRNKIEKETKNFISITNKINLEDEELVENAFFDDFRILMSNLIHLEIHLFYVNINGENDESNRNE